MIFNMFYVSNGLITLILVMGTIIHTLGRNVNFMFGVKYAQDELNRWN